MPPYVLFPLLLCLAVLAGFFIYRVYVYRIKPVDPSTLTREQQKEYANDLFWVVAAIAFVIGAGLAAYMTVNNT